MKVGIKPVLCGPVALHNQKEYPFNDSRQIVRIEGEGLFGGYVASARVLEADGEVGDIVIEDERGNGFALAFNGSAQEATVQILLAEARALGDIAEPKVALELACEADGAIVTIRNEAAASELAIDLDEKRDLYDLDVIVYADDEGHLTLDQATRYAAVIHVPAKVYDIEWGVTDEFGFQRMYKHYRPLDMDAVSVELWNEVV